ncbi:calcium ion binding [Ascochyta rabiei]|uniref:Calcium ion binding n=2 Tax=Didymella rabiei TaxID=5454 RepID=A0A163BY11_DIDRA|nr:calcium ion binding [Ascochyta rabiei]
MSSSVRSRSVVPQSTGDTQHNVRDAALIGATSAFARPPAKPQHLTNTYAGGSNGALLAATKVGTGRPSTPAGVSVPLQRDYTGGSSRSASRSRPSPKHVSSSSSLGVPDSHVDRAPSPSYTAAKLAAARLSPLRPAVPAKAANTMSGRSANERDLLPPSGSVGNVLARLEQQKPGQQRIHQEPRKRRDSIDSQPVASAAARDKSTDDTPIPPTNSLVKMFEQNRPVTPTQPPSAPSVVVKNSPPPVKSPKPQRNFTLPPEPKDEARLVRKRTHTPPPVPKSKPPIETPRSPLTDGTNDPSWTHNAPLKSPPIKQKPVQLAALNTRATTGPTTPGQGRPKSQDSKRSASFHRRLSTSLESNAPSSPASFKSAKEELEEEEKVKPALPPPRRSNTRKNESVPADVKLLKPSVPAPRRQGRGASPLQAPERLSPPNRPSSAAGSVYHKPYQRESVKAITKHMTGESLSSAIMGAALASSRQSSPNPLQPMTIEPLFPPRKQHHHHMPFHRSPSPQKASPPKATGKLRTTMRKDPSPPSSSDDEVDFKGKGNRIMGMKVRKHPNKHHEGQRKRWRDQITERERKRYEGVWAANKGILLPASNVSYPPDDDPSMDVLNLVVKEIWMRSRLPIHVLEEVWALVDSREVGRLTRVEFVVGLWLVDQRLKGRKLPTRVSDSVWTSARGLGIKVKVRG